MDDNLSKINSNDLNQEDKKDFPILIPSGKENYKEKEIEEETKENKKKTKNVNSNLKRKKKSDIINTENDIQKKEVTQMIVVA